jgi:hypothetical protein
VRRVGQALGLALAPMAIALMLAGARAPAHRTITLGYGALVTGLVVELLRLTGSSATVGAMSVVALALSLFVFIPFKGEHGYDVQSHLDLWLAAFAAVLLLLAAIELRKKLVQRLDEGTTLLHSMVFFYWMLDVGLHGTGHAIWIVVGAVPLALAAVHVWTGLALSRPVRLAMSLWSSVVLLALAVQTAVGLVRAGSVESFIAAGDLGGGATWMLGCFLFGTSSAYIVANLMMVAGYLPARRTFFNAEYFREVRRLSDQHIERMSPGQVDPRLAAAVVACVSALLAAHWFLRPFPTPVALWLVLAAVPWALQIWAWWRLRGQTGAWPNAGPDGSLRRPS